MPNLWKTSFQGDCSCRHWFSPTSLFVMVVVLEEPATSFLRALRRGAESIELQRCSAERIWRSSPHVRRDLLCCSCLMYVLFVSYVCACVVFVCCTRRHRSIVCVGIFVQPVKNVLPGDCCRTHYYTYSSLPCSRFASASKNRQHSWPPGGSLLVLCSCVDVEGSVACVARAGCWENWCALLV